MVHRRNPRAKLNHTGTFKAITLIMTAHIPLVIAGHMAKSHINVMGKFTLPTLVGDNKNLLGKGLNI